jgi:hypothetical protein
VPLDLVTPSNVGPVYLTDDTLVTGTPAHAEWIDALLRQRKIASVATGLDGTGRVSFTGVGTKGYVTLVIPSCPDVLADALRDLIATGTKTAVLRHLSSALGTKTLTVEVLSVTAQGDGQYKVTATAADKDPIEDVQVVMWSHGAAA